VGPGEGGGRAEDPRHPISTPKNEIESIDLISL
jgi:hypothetical protein